MPSIMDKIKAFEAQEKINKTVNKTVSLGTKGVKKVTSTGNATIKKMASTGTHTVKKMTNIGGMGSNSPKRKQKKQVTVVEAEESMELTSTRDSSALVRESVNSVRNSLSASLKSLDESMTENFGTDEEIEAQIRAALGIKATPTAAADMDPKASAKASRKARMSVRMSTRADAMNANRRGSRLASVRQSGNGKRMSTRMSVRTRMSTRMSVSRRGSGGFVMLKDLEERDEFNKVQGQTFLREMFKLAEEESKQHIKKTIKRKQSGKANANSKADGSIHLDGIDLTSLSREKAKETIAALHSGEKIDGNSIISLIQAGVEVLGAEETVVDARKFHSNLTNVTAVGDLHGSLECLIEVLNLVNIDNIGQDGSVIIFDGDFVDRGYNSLEVIATLLLLKLSHPKNVVLLRGNHEDSMTATSYGFRDEVDEKYGYDKGDEIWWEIGLLFAAFPIAARTNTAAIMHGGIPVEEFTLDDLNELAPETRCEMKTITDPYDDDERLLQGILWSDPAEEEGINFSDRGAGYTFGPDITAEFLDQHNLKYVIRAHEVVETGHCEQDVGDGRGCITIFSSANYPAMEGTNYGAVMFLNDQTGDYETKDFIHKEDGGESKETIVFKGFLSTFVDGHKSSVVEAFEEEENGDGYVTCEQWADIIANLLELPDSTLTWLEMQPDLAPTVAGKDDLIDWKDFLKKHSTVEEKGKTTAMSEGTQNKISTAFKYLDSNKDGVIDEVEFQKGFEILNARLPDRNKLGSHDEWFNMFESNEDGKIDFNGFKQMFCAI